MNFFEQQHQARAQTTRLVWLFALAVLAIVVAIDIVLVLIFAAAELKSSEGQQFSFVGALTEHPTALIATSIITLLVIGVSSLGKMAALRSGGPAVAASMGATPIPAQTSDPHFRRLRNVVEEMSIASGVPVPEIYVLEHEAGINAFAAGFSTADAAIVVTRGALEKLTRDELQGVIAHEFSHVLNGDMRLNIRLMGVLFGILVVGLIGRKILEGMRHARDSKGTGPLLLAALAIMILGYLGMFFGRVIKAGISRSREYLADASAVQFTRQTEGLAGALKKVGGLQAGSKLETAEAEDASHMLFCDGIGFSSMFATNPPIVDRIQRLDKHFDPKSFVEIHQRWDADDVDVLAFDDEMALSARNGLTAAGASSRTAMPPIPEHAPVTQNSLRLPKAGAELRIDANSVAAQVGNPADDDYRTADTIHHQIPEELKRAAREPAKAEAMVFALMVDGSTKTPQFKIIDAHAGKPCGEQTRTLHALVADIHPMLRLPLASIAFPALRRLPRPRLTQFTAVLERLIHVDGEVSPYEFCLASLVRAQVVDFLDPASAKSLGRMRLHECQAEAQGVLALIAELGHDDRAQAERAFQAGAATLFQGQALRFERPQDWRSFLEQALPKLDRLDATGKQLMVEALVKAISQDGKLAVSEAELLRLVCAALHCPLPPVLSL